MEQPAPSSPPHQGPAPRTPISPQHGTRKISWASQTSTGTNKPKLDCLLDVLKSVGFVNRPSKDLKLPEGWSFHAQSPSATSQAGQSERGLSNQLNDLGYFHHAGHRITTNIDISRGKVPFSDTNDGDEFAEIAVIEIPGNRLPDATMGNPENKPYVRFYVDHFNRTFGHDLGCARHPENHMHPTDDLDHGLAYTEWIRLIGQHPDSHLFKPSTEPKKYNCLGRKIAQQVVWDHQNGHITKIDIENAFSPAECTSLLSALQKKRVTDKQCQKIIRTVIDRFLTAKHFKQPPLESALKAAEEEGKEGRIVVIVALITFIIWIGPMLSIPAAYFRRLRTIAHRADAGAYLPHLWRTFIKVLLKEWSDLSIVLALVLAANVAFLALPGTSERPEGANSSYSSTLADVSRGAGIVSMFITLGGLLTTLCLIWLHQPMQGTGSSDACQYLLGSAYVQTDQESQSSKKRGPLIFLRLIFMATYLGMPLVLLLWSVIAFVISAVTWTFLFSTRAAQVTVVTLCGLVLMTPLVTIVVFWGPIISRDSLLAKAARGDPTPPA